jgi:hypothetical protein
VGLDKPGVAETIGIAKVGEGIVVVPEGVGLEIDEDGTTSKTGVFELDVEVTELLPNEVSEGVEEGLEVDGRTESTGVDEAPLLVRLEVLDVAGVVELELLGTFVLLDEVLGTLVLLGEVVDVNGTFDELEDEDTLQPGIVKYEITQSAFSALRKKTSLLK